MLRTQATSKHLDKLRVESLLTKMATARLYTRTLPPTGTMQIVKFTPLRYVHHNFVGLKLTVDVTCSVLALAGVRCAGFVLSALNALRRLRILTVLLRQVDRDNTALHGNLCATHTARPIARDSCTHVISDLLGPLASTDRKKEDKECRERLVCWGTWCLRNKGHRVRELGLGLGDHSKALCQLGRGVSGELHVRRERIALRKCLKSGSSKNGSPRPEVTPRDKFGWTPSRREFGFSLMLFTVMACWQRWYRPVPTQGVAQTA